MAAAMGNGKEMFAGGRREPGRQNKPPPSPARAADHGRRRLPQRVLHRGSSTPLRLGARDRDVDGRSDEWAVTAAPGGFFEKKCGMSTALDEPLYVPGGWVVTLNSPAGGGREVGG